MDAGCASIRSKHAGIEAGAGFDVRALRKRSQQLRLRFERPQFAGAFPALSQVRVKLRGNPTPVNHLSDIPQGSA